MFPNISLCPTGKAVNLLWISLYLFNLNANQSEYNRLWIPSLHTQRKAIAISVHIYKRCIWSQDLQAGQNSEQLPSFTLL